MVELSMLDHVEGGPAQILMFPQPIRQCSYLAADRPDRQAKAAELAASVNNA
jgi:hypothetical protein